MVPGDIEGEGLGLADHYCQDSLWRPRMGLGRIRGCMAKSWLMKLSFVPPKMAQRQIPSPRGACTAVFSREQEEEELPNTPMRDNEPSSLGWNVQSPRKWPAWLQYKQTFTDSRRFRSAWECRVRPTCIGLLVMSS